MFTELEMLYTPANIFLVVICSLVLGIICFRIVRKLLEWNRNNHSPKESCSAKVLAKRTHVFGHETAHTTYHVTFEWGDQRKEFQVSSKEYAILIEGDTGTLYFQGTRFLNFERL